MGEKWQESCNVGRLAWNDLKTCGSHFSPHKDNKDRVTRKPWTLIVGPQRHTFSSKDPLPQDLVIFTNSGINFRSSVQTCDPTERISLSNHHILPLTSRGPRPSHDAKHFIATWNCPQSLTISIVYKSSKVSYQTQDNILAVTQINSKFEFHSSSIQWYRIHISIPKGRHGVE